ncbi:uncharacterized protein LOC113471926 [Diaphorina citri]|uniref:Uncharacterized protein LOC113471926 n=1 Tax=Diaphorina citri TaxID=121845 RepID=A0A3Q0JJ95_DIACI|nr:uncharacterized protein LOC113471926 [Diaphorina citri]
MQSVLPSIIYDSNSLDPRRHLVHHRLSSPEASAGMSDAMLQLKISQPPRLSASGPSTTQTALYRLARLLNQNQKSPEAFHSATRRLSWESLGAQYHSDSAVQTRPSTQSKPEVMLQLKISQPPRLSASGPSTTQTALYRLARLLNQNQKSPEAFHSATRRLSWER